MNTFKMNSLCAHVSVIFLLLSYGVESIRNGNSANEGQFKYVVSIQYENIHVCGGAILDKYHILTAGHCVYQRVKTKFKISAGKLALDPWFPTTRLIEHIHLHQDYEDATVPIAGQAYWYENDIALLKLAQPLKFGSTIANVDLPVGPVPYNVDCEIAGWGKEHLIDDFTSSHLLYTRLQALEPEVCRSRCINHRRKEFCAAHVMNWTTLLPGDSGSPLVCRNAIVGIASAGRGYITSPVIFTDVWKFLDFVDDRRSFTEKKSNNHFLQAFPWSWK